MTKKIFRPPLFIYEKFIKKQKEGVPFVIFSFFLIIFAASRLYVHLAIKGIVPESLTQDVKGVHIHHFTYGILINTLVGFLALNLPYSLLGKWRLKLAAFFGIGLGWTFDEFGMWLRLQDEYWARLSYDSIIIISLILINIIYLGTFWNRLASKISKKVKRKKSISSP